MRIRPARMAVAAFSALALAACGERGGPVAPAPPPEQPAALLASVRCTADARAGTLSCSQAALPGAARGYIIVGGQGTYVQLTSSNVAYNSGTHIFSFDMTVQNLIPQPLATTDGTTADANGVRVIFASGPNVLTGEGCRAAPPSPRPRARRARRHSPSASTRCPSRRRLDLGQHLVAVPHRAAHHVLSSAGSWERYMDRVRL
ncbi:hypothetical protein [Longimicrobium sp.]|uniref:hypothetical protein n=1 Tax=Longimicrobium sp. TaxID=2029185 RepID=UPI002C9F6FFF|nr:hypothetical protein [Longimicrobium sp.]HSU13611.1 hypothetical protein [Longimicrobium sp.]